MVLIQYVIEDIAKFGLGLMMILLQIAATATVNVNQRCDVISGKQEFAIYLGFTVPNTNNAVAVFFKRRHVDEV